MAVCIHLPAHTLTDSTIIVTRTLIQLNAGFGGNRRYVYAPSVPNGGQAHENREPEKTEITHKQTKKNRKPRKVLVSFP